MTENDIKIKIREAFRAEAPDLSARIEESCRRETPERSTKSRVYSPLSALRKTAAIAASLLIFILGGLLGYFIPKGEAPSTAPMADTFVYLDVNPSVELRIDKNNDVVECLGVNDDAKTVLSGLSLEGVDLNTALTAIIGSMYVNGYLTEASNSILVSVESDDDTRATGFLTEITDKINTVFDKSEMECSIIAQRVSATEELREKAKENGISLGKMQLVDQMIDELEDLSVDDLHDLSDMSIRELNLMYSEGKRGDNGHEEDEDHVTSGSVGGYVDKLAALESFLVGINASIDSITSPDFRVTLGTVDGERRMLYRVSFSLKDSGESYVLEIDCTSGEIIKSELAPTEQEDGRPSLSDPEHEDSEDSDSDDEYEHEAWTPSDKDGVHGGDHGRP